MTILMWIVGLALCAFVAATGLGKISLSNGAQQSVGKLGISGIKMQLFGAIELAAAALILLRLLAPQLAIVAYIGWLCLLLVLLWSWVLLLQHKAQEPLAAKMGPIVVINLTVVFAWLSGII